jgi:translation initiation factor IF-3
MVIKRYIINERIRAKDVRLIDDEGEQLGVVSLQDARDRAAAKSLDLLLVSETADPPVCKIIDYGQFRYQQKKKEKKNKKGAKGQVLKELKMRPSISIHDYMVRVKHGIEFFQKGYKVQLTVFFKGREAIHPELGYELIDRFIEAVAEYAVKEGDPGKPSRRSIVVTFGPK